MRQLRISAISYLNTAPLMWDFEHGSAGKDFEISYTIPSQCAEALAKGEADIGIIPSIAFATIPNLAIIPGAAIAAKNAVRSILLVSKLPLEYVRSVALDTSSRTSAILVQILLRKFIGGPEREFVPSSPDLPAMLRRCDAALLIGDPALKVSRSEYRTYDLAEEWRRCTGKPFVFAFWAVRLAALSELSPTLDLQAIFSGSRDHGLLPENVTAIAREWSKKLGITEEQICSYLTQNIHYRLDTENLEGLELFYRYAAQLRLIAEPPPLRFLGSMALRYCT